MMIFKTIVSLLFVTAIIIFSVQNSEATDIKFLIWDLNISRVLVILGSFSLGMLVGLLLCFKPKAKNKAGNK